MFNTYQFLNVLRGFIKLMQGKGYNPVPCPVSGGHIKIPDASTIRYAF
jgi:hypothetical protein